MHDNLQHRTAKAYPVASFSTKDPETLGHHLAIGIGVIDRRDVVRLLLTIY